jgi:hypothetical protein
MKADVTITPAAPRTYAVPKAVSSIVVATLNTPSRASSNPTVTDLDLELAKKLALEERITADDAFSIHTGLTASASSDLSYSLRGGSEGRDWASKIVDGIRKDELRVRDTTLEAIDYQPENYYYFGLSDHTNPELLRAVGRVPIGDYTLDRADVLVASGGWQLLSETPEIESVINAAIGTHLETALLASGAAAFMSGFRAVYLSYATPECFLDTVPLLASGIPDEMVNEGEYIYAVVDPTDTTAVVNLIMLKPGPQAYIRSGGSWVLDETTLDSLLSVTPPPIVELNGPTLQTVIQQVDANQAQQLALDTQTGEATEGAKLLEKPVEKTEPKKESKEVQRQTKSGGVGTGSAKITDPGPSPNGTMPPRPVAASGLPGRIRFGYENGLNVTAALAVRDADGDPTIHTLSREARVRETAMRAAIALKDEAVRRLQVLEDVIVPITAGAQHPDDAIDANQRRAEPLRTYWLRGVGSTKVMWGVKGDFERCRSLLSPYLGARAAGYCAKMHHRATGTWPGSKSNSAEHLAAQTLGESNSARHMADEESDELVEGVSEENVEEVAKEEN